VDFNFFFEEVKKKIALNYNQNKKTKEQKIMRGGGPLVNN